MEKRIQAQLEQMTLEEKASLCSGLNFWKLKGVERLDIPSVMMSDGPHGLRKQNDKADHLGVNESIQSVCFPAGCATACSFDPNLLERLGQILGRECRAQDVAILLGPAVNIKRSPLCGRNFEYFSEDPYLAGKLAAAQIKGVQSWKVGTSVKHFAANNQEYRRMSCSAQVSERALREIYLPPFETAVKESDPWTVMCSYNRINGVFASENRDLLTEILRKEWGFAGFTVSDWGAVNDRVKGVAAGLDLEMPGSGGKTDEQIVQAVREGVLSEAVLDQTVKRILAVIYKYLSANTEKPNVSLPEDHALAVQMESECAVLLKNNGVLPLKRVTRVAYIGAFAVNPRYQGGGSSHINAYAVPGALTFAGKNTVYAEGFNAQGESREEKIEQAVLTARDSDCAVIFAGLPDILESEGYDRPHMRLPECQDELIRRVAQAQPNTVVVLHYGSPVETPWAEDVAAVLCMYLGGEGVGEATDALLYGDVNPSGRLAETWPIKLSDSPSYLNFPGDGEEVIYAEDVFVGYRYYDKKGMTVRWPFGHGESYTTFSYGEPRLSAGEMTDAGKLEAFIDITNTGSVRGSEVVQLYVANTAGASGQPVRELKGFAKVMLEPGETKTLSFVLNERSFAHWSVQIHDWYASPGTYLLEFAHSSRDIRQKREIRYITSKMLPLKLTRNTTIGELLADNRTRSIMTELVQMVKASQQNTDDEGSAAKEAISPEMKKQMLLNAPLRILT